MPSSLAFYIDFLGFAAISQVNNPLDRLQAGGVYVNDQQYVKLFPEKEAGSDRLVHIALQTDDVEGMRSYLASCKVKVPAEVSSGQDGSACFDVTDPDGHTVEFVQYHPGDWTRPGNGKQIINTPISTHLTHVGITVGSLERSLAFYHDILGFQEIWRGSANGSQLSWVNMKAPEGDDYIEFMLYKDAPSQQRWGTMHHFCLEAPDISKTLAVLEARSAHRSYTRPLDIRTGINRKRQLNLFDPDGTRIELMEPHTVDGVPAPSSTAPPPIRQPKLLGTMLSTDGL